MPRRFDETLPYRLTGRPDPNRTARWGPAPKPGDDARCIAALCVDGGTAFATFADREHWHPLFASTMRKLLELQAKLNDPDEVPDLDKIPPLQLPLPSLPTFGARNEPGLAGVLVASDPNVVDYRAFGFGDGQWPIPTIKIRGRSIELDFHDRCYVKIGRRRDPAAQCTRWYVRLEAKHKELYERGHREWRRTWLGYFSWLLFGRWADVGGDKQSRLGWTGINMQVNSDFTGSGMFFVGEDKNDVVAARRYDEWGRSLSTEDVVELDDAGEDSFGFSLDDLGGVVAADDVDDRAPEYIDDDEDEWRPADGAETLQIGGNTSDIQVKAYDKIREQRFKKKVDPSASAYALRHWLSNGWKAGDPVWRVELVLRKKGLVFVDPDDLDRKVYDFRNPDTLDDPKALPALWAYVTERRRLVDRVATRLRRCPTDERWKVVQSAAGAEPDTNIRQLPHVIAALTRATRIAKQRVHVFEAMQHLAAMEHGTAIADPLDIAAAMREFADRIEAGAVVVDGEGDGLLAKAYRPFESVRNKIALIQFYAHELVGLHDEFAEALRQRGGTGAISVFDLLPHRPEQEDDPPDRPPDG